MDQQQQQQQQPQGGGPQPPPSPVRAAAAAAASAALAAGSVAVARSVSIESHGAGSVGGSISTEGPGGSTGGVPTREGSGAISSSASVGGGDVSLSGSHTSGSFRASPAATPREPVTNVPSFPTQQATSQQPQPRQRPAVAPPPWPTSNAAAATPQRPIHAAQQPLPGITPQRSTSPIPTGSVASAGQGPMPPPPLVNTVPSFPPPVGGAGSLSLSMTKSGESLFSQPQPPNLNAGTNTAATSQGVDSSVLLGLEELERQQADSEKRKVEKLWEEQRIKQQQQQQRQEMQAQQQQQMQQQQQQLQTIQGQQQHQQQPLGLPPLPPSSNPPAGGRPVSAPTSGQYPEVPAHIHLTDDNEEDTILGSDVDKKELKRVTSIEKLRGSVQVGLRRFRSWSQDALNRSSMDNPAASSVDSTQNATLTSGEEGGGGRKSPEGSSTKEQTTPKSSNKKLGTSVVSEPYLDDDELKPLIYGYLHKLGRNGHWQRRFFETNGESLTYYKSVKRAKLLATLDLCKVGEITIDKTDPEECTFTIQVKNRPYYLRAEDKARCNDWVITLNRAREARMNVGNIHLNAPKMEPGEGGVHRSQAGSDDYAPMIVISALRPRTRKASFGEGGVDALSGDLLGATDTAASHEQEEIEVTRWDENRQSSASSPQLKESVVGVVGSSATSPTSPAGGDQSMAKWQKRHSKMHILSLRFLKWARSITHQADACRREKDVVVVPAHVVLAAQQAMASSVAGGTTSSTGAMTGGAAETAAAGIGGTQQGPKQGENPRLPNLLEEPQQAPTTPVATENTLNRSRANTESPAFEAC